MTSLVIDGSVEKGINLNFAWKRSQFKVQFRVFISDKEILASMALLLRDRLSERNIQCPSWNMIFSSLHKVALEALETYVKSYF